jgi:8-oxo-dGTP diphosphatase
VARLARASSKRAAPAPGSEEAFLAAYDPAAYARPSVAVDVVVVSADAGELRALLVRRTEHPHRDAWALPGGFVQPDESLDEAAARVLREKAGLDGVFLEQLYTFGAPARDPRTRVISVAYYALVDPERLRAASGHAPEAWAGRLQIPWAGEAGGPVEVVGPEERQVRLAFDHADVLGVAVKRLRGKLDYAPLGFQLLPPTFTLLELQRVHETVLGRALNKDSFRRRMLAAGQLEATGRMQTGVEHRPAELYRFARRSAI